MLLVFLSCLRKLRVPWLTCSLSSVFWICCSVEQFSRAQVFRLVPEQRVRMRGDLLSRRGMCWRDIFVAWPGRMR